MPIRYIKGDLLGHVAKLPAKAIYAHACNPRGAWGAGVAVAFKKSFPDAYPKHQTHCRNAKIDDLLGSAQVIESVHKGTGAPSIVVCLFTSDYQTKFRPEQVAEFTDESLAALAREADLLEDGEKTEDGKIIINLPLINAGLFGVPWELTEAALRKHTDTFAFNVYVLELLPGMEDK
ncbi:ADP-ribose 1''-phosphate phosphatase [Diutina catenulata]